MPTRNANPEQRTSESSAKLQQLSEAADDGFAAIDRGEYDVLTPNKIGPKIRAFGKRAAARTRRSAK